MNAKDPARDVRTICKALPKNTFNKAAANNYGNRGTQWRDVERQFKTDCDMAQRIILTPKPNNSMLQTIDPNYSETVYTRVMENAGLQPSCLNLKTVACKSGGSRRRRHRKNKSRRNH